MTLLEQAQSLGKKPKQKKPVEYSVERAQLALAWSKGMVAGASIAKVLGVLTINVSNVCTGLLVKGIRRGDIKAEMRRGE